VSGERKTAVEGHNTFDGFNLLLTRKGNRRKKGEGQAGSWESWMRFDLIRRDKEPLTGKGSRDLSLRIILSEGRLRTISHTIGNGSSKKKRHSGRVCKKRGKNEGKGNLYLRVRGTNPINHLGNLAAIRPGS